MKLKTKHFKIKTETENFVAIYYTSKKWLSYDIEHYLELYEEMLSKGYDYYCDGEFDYFIFKKIRRDTNSASSEINSQQESSGILRPDDHEGGQPADTISAESEKE